jgi:Rieske Fe-S protein
VLHVFAACTATACSAGSATPEPVGNVQAGTVAELPTGSVHPIGSLPVCIGRDTDGIYAMTLTCTHAGCNMAQDGVVAESGITCICHGSRFDADGNVVRGPARDPLQHFGVTADATGNLTILGDEYVAQNVRLIP